MYRKRPTRRKSARKRRGDKRDILELKSAAPSGATVAAPVFFFQKVTYSFRTSGVYPNALGLWRNVEGGMNEELVAPFDTSAAIPFLSSRRRHVARLSASGPKHPRHRTRPRRIQPRKGVEQAAMPMQKVVTSVFFKNVRAY